MLAYSNGNYLALGQLIEKLRAKPFGEVLTEGIFRPLGLEQTSLGGRGVGHQQPQGLHSGGRGTRGCHPARVPRRVPRGGVVSSAEDVNDFYRGLLAGELLSPSTLEEMKTETSKEYGLGLASWPDGCSSTGYLYGHSGSVYGYLTVSMASEDGDRQITLAMALPTLPAKVGDPVTTLRIDRYGSQMELAARKALDQLCA